MHELLLYGQVPGARHEQVLNVLAGVAAMQPRRIIKRHVIYKPQREPEEPGSHIRRGGTQAVGAAKPQKQAAVRDLHYSQIVQHLSEHDFDRGRDDGQSSWNSLIVDDEDEEENAKPKWSYVFNDVPDPVDRGVLVRQSSSSDILQGDAHAYAVGLGNRFVTEYYVQGHQFVLGNVVIFLHRVLHEPGVRPQQTAPKDALPSFSALQPLDPSGACVFEARIRVLDLKEQTLLASGVDELLKFRATMKGCVELMTPDRLSLDTRVKYKPNTAASQVKSAQTVAR